MCLPDFLRGRDADFRWAWRAGMFAVRPLAGGSGEGFKYIHLIIFILQSLSDWFLMRQLSLIHLLTNYCHRIIQ